MALTTVRSTGISSLPAISAANLTSIPAANLTGTLPAINGSALTGISGGKIGQVLNTVWHNNNTTTSSTYSATSGTLAITPTATNSKVLVIINACSIYCANSDTNIDLAISRSGGASGDGNILEFEGTAGYDQDTVGVGGGGSTISYLDSPATTSAVTYGLQFRSSNNSHNVYINHWVRGDVRPRSAITLMEVLN